MLATLRGLLDQEITIHVGNTYFQGTLDAVIDGIAYLTMSTSTGTQSVWARVDKILAVECIERPE